MLETIRHEAVHEYLDRLGANPPIWLNEGLAEYLSYIPNDRAGGYFREGDVRSPRPVDRGSSRNRLQPLEHDRGSARFDTHD